MQHVVFFFNKNKPCLFLALFIKERGKNISIGGWVLGNDDVIIKVGIGNDDV